MNKNHSEENVYLVFYGKRFLEGFESSILADIFIKAMAKKTKSDYKDFHIEVVSEETVNKNGYSLLTGYFNFY